MPPRSTIAKRPQRHPRPYSTFWSRGACGRCRADCWTRDDTTHRRSRGRVLRWSCFVCGADEFDPPTRQPEPSECDATAPIDTEAGCRQATPAFPADADRC